MMEYLFYNAQIKKEKQDCPTTNEYDEESCLITEETPKDKVNVKEEISEDFIVKEEISTDLPLKKEEVENTFQQEFEITPGIEFVSVNTKKELNEPVLASDTELTGEYEGFAPPKEECISFESRNKTGIGPSLQLPRLDDEPMLDCDTEADVGNDSEARESSQIWIQEGLHNQEGTKTTLMDVDQDQQDANNSPETKIKSRKRFCCAVCGFTCEARNEWRSHASEHLGDRNNSEKEQEVKKKVAPEPKLRFSCSKCNFTCEGRRKYSAHVFKHLPEFKKKAEERQNRIATLFEMSQKKFRCKECGLMCKTEEDFATHHSSKHSVVVKVTGDEEKQNRIATHIETSKKKFCCGMCGLMCKSENELTIHSSEHTVVVKRMRVKASNKNESSEQSELKRSCFWTDCNFETNYKRSYTKHLSSHLKLVEFKCFECGYKTNFKRRLKTHITSHNSVKEYRCSACDYGTNDKKNLVRHSLIHSEVNRDKVFQCDKCPYETKRQNNLNTHMSSHDQIQMLQVYNLAVNSVAMSNLRNKQNIR